jgi:stage III sporulation protein AH
MNAKRQTVWLVSMLSLMVVLSAYYLFTEDVKKVDVASQQLQGNEIKVDTTGTATGDKKAADTAKTATKSEPASAKATDAKTGTTTTTTDANKAKSDAEVLKQVSTTAQSGSDYFKTAQIKRDEELSILTEKWMTVSLDSKKSTEEVSKALNELEKIQDQEARVSNLENLLVKDFKNALVLQEGNKWKVVVQAAKLERSQGVSIVDLVMKELNIGADKISIQYVK